MVDASANKKDIFSRFLETYKSNKKKVLSSFLALITILLLTLYINHSNKKKNIAVSNKFNNAKILIEKKNFVKSKIYLLEVIEAKNKFYSPAALYLIIENNLEKEQEIILELFDKILENKKIDKNNINLIKLKKVLFLFDLINEEEILNILNPIINSESLWKRNAIILLADYYKSKNEINKSEQLYKLLSTINKS